MHNNLEGIIPIVLGTIPLTSFQVPNQAPYSDVPATKPHDISNIPTQPVSPASPPANGTHGMPGWNASLYPSIRKYLLMGTQHVSNTIIKLPLNLNNRSLFLLPQHHRLTNNLHTATLSSTKTIHNTPVLPAMIQLSLPCIHRTTLVEHLLHNNKRNSSDHVSIQLRKTKNKLYYNYKCLALVIHSSRDPFVYYLH